MQQSPARQPLHERSVNTPIAAIGPEPVVKTNTNLKRRINNVDSPEYPASPLRLRVTQQSPVKDYTSASTMTAKPSQSKPVVEMPENVQMKENIEEGDSQDSLNDSLLSRTNSDPMEDTMVSEQTASTEVSQLDRSAASVHAELLRLRLRVAMFKVRTGQTNIPMSLCVSPDPPQLPVLAPQPTVPRLLPAPILQPTAYSARMIELPRISSSPPTSQHGSPARQAQIEARVPDDVFRTPALPKHKRGRVAEGQLSSPPDSQERDDGMDLDEPTELTSSVVRGNAARDLLGLMRSR